LKRAVQQTEGPDRERPSGRRLHKQGNLKDAVEQWRRRCGYGTLVAPEIDQAELAKVQNSWKAAGAPGEEQTPRKNQQAARR
jgi:hypothetical protein